MFSDILSSADFIVILISFAMKLAGATAALGLIAVCEVVGAKMYGINLKQALDKVEANPDAFSQYCTGRFIGACIILGCIIG